MQKYSSSGYSHIVGSANPLTGAGGFGLRTTSGEIALVGNGNSQGNYATTIPLNTWIHIAAVRNGTGAGSVQDYKNGTALTGTGNNAGNASFASSLALESSA